mmetsp:Transcript_80244/g.215025  ORF Transcript_80244/g.215025 Transcript_80244/m.215025 type:complete len:182 (-) Transcript_80244:120-665(-)
MSLNFLGSKISLFMCISHIKAFTTATRSLGIRVFKYKLCFHGGLHKIHTTAQQIHYSLGVHKDLHTISIDHFVVLGCSINIIHSVRQAITPMSKLTANTTNQLGIYPRVRTPRRSPKGFGSFFAINSATRAAARSDTVNTAFLGLGALGARGLTPSLAAAAGAERHLSKILRSDRSHGTAF